MCILESGLVLHHVLVLHGQHGLDIFSCSVAASTCTFMVYNFVSCWNNVSIFICKLLCCFCYFLCSVAASTVVLSCTVMLSLLFFF